MPPPTLNRGGIKILFANKASQEYFSQTEVAVETGLTYSQKCFVSNLLNKNNIAALLIIILNHAFTVIHTGI